MEFEIVIFPSGAAEITVNGEYMLFSAAPYGAEAAAETVSAVCRVLEGGGRYNVGFEGGGVSQTLTLYGENGRLFLEITEQRGDGKAEAFGADAPAAAAAAAFEKAALKAVQPLLNDKAAERIIQDLQAALENLSRALKKNNSAKSE